jgi:20S proteasome subunit alpha 3
MEAISHAGTAIGILGSDGIVLAAEKKISSKLLEPAKSSEKMYMIDDHVACAVAGITADANILINQARLHAQRYQFNYQEPQPVEQLVQRLCDEKQAYTQYGGLRPFGVSLLYAGWDKTFGYQLYASDPSGNYGGWKATSIGANSQAAQSLMKQEYKADTMPLSDALKLAIKVLNKTCDSTTLTADKFDLATVTQVGGKVKYTQLSEAQSQALLDANKEESASGDA